MSQIGWYDAWLFIHNADGLLSYHPFKIFLTCSYLEMVLNDAEIGVDVATDKQIVRFCLDAVVVMQHNILKHGFIYCGIIYLLSGDERLAYQKTRI